MLTGYYQKKQSFQNRPLKGTKIFLKKKTKSVNMAVNDIGNF